MYLGPSNSIPVVGKGEIPDPQGGWMKDYPSYHLEMATNDNIVIHCGQ